MKSVVFVCVANSCRSQMAEVAAKSIAGDKLDIWSAGSNPSGIVNPLAIEIMSELGFDMMNHYSKGVDGLPKRKWDVVVTMGCGDNCPTLQAGTRFDWDIADPVGCTIEVSRKIRDDIIERVKKLVQDIS